MPAPHETDWTVDDLDALPEDGNRYELLDGELFVTPAPSDIHQLVAGVLYARLHAYLRPFRVARAIISPSDVRRDDRRRNRVQPDVFAVRLRDGQRPPYPFDLADLLLAVEVASPSNGAFDYQAKRRLYLAAGVAEYWIVDADTQTFARWTALAKPGELLTERLVWHPAGMPQAFELEIPEFFEDALG